MNNENDLRQSVGLPIHVFLYTLDQVADMLRIEQEKLHLYMFYDGRSLGVPPADKMHVKNIKGPGVTPEWRLEEHEFIRWCKNQHITLMGRHYLSLGKR